MRKSIVSSTAGAKTTISDIWRDLERIARVEITSEDDRFPIENVFAKAGTTGWRASTTGPQVIRLFFDEPLTIRRIHLHFVERTTERSQEFALYAGTSSELKEITRQQWNFNPNSTTEEDEDYKVELIGITLLELRIDPDRSHNPELSQNFASLQTLQLA